MNDEATDLYMIRIRTFDNRFYLTCQQVPGMFLVGDEVSKVLADFEPVRKRLEELNGKPV